MKSHFRHLLSLGILFVIFSSNLMAQSYPQDTSYTTRSAYEKYVQRFPDISIVEPNLNGLTHKKQISYKDLGYRSLTLDLFYPEDSTKSTLPAIVLIHGGGWISGNKSMLHPMAAELARLGFVTITPEYRLSPEAQYPAALSDVFDVLNWITTQHASYPIDTSSVILFGTSAGGQLASLTGTIMNESPWRDSTISHHKLKAIIDIDGVLAFIHPDSKEGNVAGKWLGGDQTEARDTWMQASAHTHVDRENPPMLFIGSKQKRFLAGREEVQDTLRKYQTYTFFHRFEEAAHSFWLFHPWFDPTIEQISIFLRVVR